MAEAWKTVRASRVALPTVLSVAAVCALSAAAVARWGFTTTALASAVFSAAMVALAAINLDRGILPDTITLPGVALARLWLIEPGDICDVCPMRAECPDRTRCLHLVASAGTSVVDPDADWSPIEGDFRRFPMGVRKIGRKCRTTVLIRNHS